MKAQISFVEYLVAFTIFVGFFGYFYIQVLKFVPEYLNQIRTQRIRSEAYQISELLVNDPGDPINWHLVGTVRRLGLSDETKNLTNFLSLSKINAIGDGTNLCKPGYENVKKWLASDSDFSIIFTRKSPSEATLINCRPSVTGVKAVNVTVRRIVFFGSGYGELIVQMW
jgi:hypothetical protein